MRLDAVRELVNIIGTPDQPTVVVAMQLLGDVKGYLLFLMPLVLARSAWRPRSASGPRRRRTAHIASCSRSGTSWRPSSAV
jgi:hypothetical protein